MSIFHVEPLPYPENTALWFSNFANTLGAIWLDSAEHASGRFDAFTAHPALLLTQQDNSFAVSGTACSPALASDIQSVTATATTTTTSTTKPPAPATQLFEVIAHLRNALYGTSLENHQLTEHLTAAEQQWLPGVLGLMGYNIGSADLRLKPRDTVLHWPQAVLGFYAWIVVIDHHEKSAWLTTHSALLAQCNLSVAALKAQITRPLETQLASETDSARAPQPAAENSILNDKKPDAGYTAQFNQVKAYLLAGDCYQINLARRVQIPAHSAPFELYKKVRRATKAPYSGFFNLEQGQCLCFSPEQFLTLNAEGDIFTSPIKGTLPRSDNPATDARAAQALSESAKDRAENLMIVDLLRNDFGRFCQPHSIKVPKLMTVQSFATVHHLVSEVHGKTQKGVTAEQVLAACFPGGSITGAPKKRAMQIIDELETQDRHAFCGSLVHLGANGTLNANICIRTGILQRNTLTLWAGGGIVIDSDLETEWIETLWKIQKILEVCH